METQTPTQEENQTALGGSAVLGVIAALVIWHFWIRKGK